MDKVVQLLDCSEFDDDFDFPKKLSEVAAWADRYLSQVPDEFKNDAIVTFDHETDYDVTRITLDIYYLRPETSEETKERELKTLATRLQRGVELKVYNENGDVMPYSFTYTAFQGKDIPDRANVNSKGEISVSFKK